MFVLSFDWIPRGGKSSAITTVDDDRKKGKLRCYLN